MGIASFILRNLSQTLVYWANPVRDGFNNYTYDAPIEIKGRCEFISELVVSETGEEQVSKAHVYLDRVVANDEYLYLGSLDDLDSAPVPATTEGSMRVIAVSTITSLGSSDRSVYKAFLNKPYINN